MVLIAYQIISIIIINDGQFIYTLDDPYIHLALAENIFSGHYGINISETSSPSSSIIWPFILAPVSFFDLSPLLINITLSFFSILTFYKVLTVTCTIHNLNLSNKLSIVLGICFILFTNLIGLCLTGMEHNLQLLFSCLCFLGLIMHVQDGQTRQWFLAVILLSPMIRYENLSISAACLLYLLLNKEFSKSIFTGLLLTIVLIAFSTFLISQDLNYLPSSILVKSEAAENTNINSLFANLYTNIKNKQGIWMTLGAIFFIIYSLNNKKPTKNRKVALTSACAILLHLFAGKFGWFNRYEMYIWAYSFLTLLFLYLPKNASLSFNHKKTFHFELPANNSPRYCKFQVYKGLIRSKKCQPWHLS